MSVSRNPNSLPKVWLCSASEHRFFLIFRQCLDIFSNFIVQSDWNIEKWPSPNDVSEQVSCQVFTTTLSKKRFAIDMYSQPQIRWTAIKFPNWWVMPTYTTCHACGLVQTWGPAQGQAGSGHNYLLARESMARLLFVWDLRRWLARANHCAFCN